MRRLSCPNRIRICFVYSFVAIFTLYLFGVSKYGGGQWNDLFENYDDDYDNDDDGGESMASNESNRNVANRHPSINACKYPILFPDDPNLHPHIQHGRRARCWSSQSNLVEMDDERSQLIVHQSLAKDVYDRYVRCFYRPLAGGVRPGAQDIVILRGWKEIGGANNRSSASESNSASAASDDSIATTTSKIKTKKTKTKAAKDDRKSKSKSTEFGPRTTIGNDGSDQRSTKIDDDIVEVRCYLEDEPNVGDLLDEDPRTENVSEVFRYAFAQIGDRRTSTSDDTMRVEPSESEQQHRPPKYAVDILVLDSTSLNMFRRHAPISWRYMKRQMGMLHFDGYAKVADNSLVNLIPLLSGLRYIDDGQGGKSDLPVGVPLDSETVPLLWRLFKAAKCSTMFNDDIAHPARGFWNYPRKQTPGFAKKPTDHFYRPWNLYHRSFPVYNSSQFCFGSRPYFADMIRLTERMIRRYRDRCHFSFNFVTDLTHDDSNNLELADEYLAGTLSRLMERGDLENTILIVMGDHGNRVNLIRYKYVGRIEERTPFFAVYLPPSFRRRYPEAVKNMRINQHRLVSHYDSHQMLRDILYGTISANETTSVVERLEMDDYEQWIGGDGSKRKGISLFKPIPTNRTCRETGVPENHCVCLIPARTFDRKGTDAHLSARAIDVITDWTNNRCKRPNDHYSIRLRNISVLTTNQYVQYGVRHLTDDNATVALLKKKQIQGDIEYLETTYDIWSAHWADLGYRPIKAVARLQHNRKLSSLLMNVEPRILRGAPTQTHCDELAQSRDCVCLHDCVLYCV